jgi:CRP-like cAMP-binding protein
MTPPTAAAPSPIAALQDVPMFSQLREMDLARLAGLVLRKRARKNEVLLLRGDTVTTLHIIASGQVKLVATGEDGREVILSTRGIGDFFGELSLFDNEPLNATVIATEDTDLLLLRREEFYRFLKESPDIAIGLLRTFTGRLRRAETRISTLALLGVPQRVAHVLLDLADEHDGALIAQPVTHRFLAQLVGTSRETVSRVMSQLSDEGVITVTRETLALPDRRAGVASPAATVSVQRRAIRIMNRPALEAAAGR